MKLNFSTAIIISIVFTSFLLNPQLISLINKSNNQSTESSPETQTNNIPNYDDDVSTIKKIETPGHYALKAFFSQNNIINIGPEGDALEWVSYDDIRYSGWSSSYSTMDFRIDSSYTYNPDCWPNQVDTYTYMKDNGYPYPVSVMYSPVFEEETYIQGKVHFLTYLRTNFDYAYSLTITFRIRLMLFNTTDSTSSEIISIEDDLGYDDYTQAITYDYTLGSPVTIPAGFRLKVAYDTKLSTLSYSGNMFLYAGDRGYNTLHWNIYDGDYSAYYSISSTDEILGVQFDMYDTIYPNIITSGFSNNTIYQENKTISIDVSGAEDSSYTWDYGTPVSFGTYTTTDLPFTMGWHTLAVQALDEYENNKTMIYEIGYDGSIINIALQSPSNNSVVGKGEILDFEIFSIDYATYEWDNSGTQNNLTSPEYDIIAPAFDGIHNLTITTHDVFETKSFYYEFNFDGIAPAINLVDASVSNNSIQPAGKLIDINVTDPVGVAEVYYKWDSRDNFTWYAFDGSIYRTYLPESAGVHTLYVSAKDNYDNAISLVFRFTAQLNQILVELRNVNDNSYFQGNNVIEVTMLGINNTIKYKWDSGSELDGLLDAFYVNSTLILNGTNVLPYSPLGEHYLTIRTFDTSDMQHIYIFKFTLDREAPVILTDKLEYDGKRFLDTDTLQFSFSDNFSSVSQLDVILSVDGITNHSLIYPYNFNLLSLSDGTYNLTIYVYDIADNFAIRSYLITIDNTAPEIEIINMEDIVYLQGQYYIPGDFNVSVLITDDDSQINSTYSWGGTEYNDFSNSFILSFIDGTSVLYINASDSLGNHEEISITLTIDSTAPISTLVFPFINSKINSNTTLDFVIEDISRATIETIYYTWDYIPAAIFFPLTFNSLGEATFDGYPESFYPANGTTAVLSVYVEDIVGNNHTYTYSFVVDNEGPNYNLQLYNEDTEQWEILKITETYLITNDSLIRIVAENTEDTFNYFWNNETDRPINKSTWLISDVPDYGLVNLTIVANDDSGERLFPNEKIITFHFTNKKEGALIILNSNDQVIYGDNLRVRVVLQDDLSNNQSIIKISVNGTSLSFSLETASIYYFDYTIRKSKGNYNLQIIAESDLYFGKTNNSLIYNFVVLPLPLNLTIASSSLEVIAGSAVELTGTLTFLNGTPVEDMDLIFNFYIYYKDNSFFTITAAFTDYDNITTRTGQTNSYGIATVTFTPTEDLDHISVDVSFEGSDILGNISLDFSQSIVVIKAGLQSWLLYTIIGGSLVIIAIVSLIIYRATRSTPFEDLLSKVTEEDVMIKLQEFCPGVILTIFDQRQGAIPILTDHSFGFDHSGRIALESDNFILKVSDQAFSALGFEETLQGRRLGSLTLPNESMLGFLQGIQIQNKEARGGLENLVLVVLTDLEYGTTLLTYQEYLHPLIDDLQAMLQEKKPLKEIESQMRVIRLQAVKVILAGYELE